MWHKNRLKLSGNLNTNGFIEHQNYIFYPTHKLVLKLKVFGQNEEVLLLSLGDKLKTESIDSEKVKNF